MSSHQEQSKLTLVLYPDLFTVHRLPRSTVVPADVLQSPWYTISKTTDELSVILPAAYTHGPPLTDATKVEPGWRCLKIEAVLDLSLVGILTTVADPLRDAGVPIFVVSTYDTDYVLIKEAHVEEARRVIVEQAGHQVIDGPSVFVI
ncbi:ACT domain-containing protein [Jimgerdemannia flammicorona]|uniref:ACT domain-containing protein n=2 Tax=Jimgerdemannia flammicorona TaxID=994334 RepID=A0A433D2T1_9FUNG|nr:ACT domain-containing protein [Jimgerdemannia flammicorona]RUS32807.1 ACT domain-containing protein [Jimgerdemannia flammicorona]